MAKTKSNKIFYYLNMSKNLHNPSEYLWTFCIYIFAYIHAHEWMLEWLMTIDTHIEIYIRYTNACIYLSTYIDEYLNVDQIYQSKVE